MRARITLQMDHHGTVSLYKTRFHNPLYGLDMLNLCLLKQQLKAYNCAGFDDASLNCSS
jgi:hypothetical protein